MTTYQRQPFVSYGRQGLPKTTARNRDTRINQRLHSETDSNKFISNKPTSILKKPPRKKQLQQQYQDRRQPVNYVSTHDINNTGFVPHSFRYSPISTPPRLRTLVTPPGPESYRYDSHLFASQLPSLDGWRPPLSFDTPGINPLDYRISSPSLYRFKPSPLSHYAIPSPKQKKPYIVVPRLHNVSLILSPQNSFIPDSRYSYLSTMAPAAIPGLLRTPSDHIHMRSHEAVSNHYINDFIGKCIEDEYIPDLLMEIISELEKDNYNRKPQAKSYKQGYDEYFAQLNNQDNYSHENGRLYSDQLITEHINPSQLKQNINSNLPFLSTDDLKQLDQPITNNYWTNSGTGSKFSQLAPGIQAKENGPVMNDIERHTRYADNKPRNDQVQLSTMPKDAENKLLDILCMNELTRKYLNKNGFVADNDDQSRFLDGTMLNVLIQKYQNIGATHSETLVY